MAQTLDTEGKRLKYIREKILGISLEAFGTPIAKHFSAVQKWEAGLAGIDPSIKLLLEHVYCINPAWLSTGLGEIIFTRRNLNVYQMPVYELSNKSYADVFSKNNVIDNKDIIHADLTHDLANIFFAMATKATIGIEKDDLLIVSSDCGKDKSLSHYLVEGKSVLEIRLLQLFNKCGIMEIKYSKTSNIQALPISVDNTSLDESQIKCKVIKTVGASLWKNASVILI